MSDGKTVRKMVSEAYAKAVNSPGTGCCAGPMPKGVVAKLAGYTRAELDLLPEDAVVNSFGCGNPLAYSEVEPGQVVLDLGAGAGIDLLLAAQKVGPQGRAIGVDMTDDMITRARENISKSGLANVEVRQGIIEQLPVEDRSVDWVISNCVINLSPEKPRVFAEIARVLKPGGQLLVSDIVAEDLPEVIRQSAALYASCVAGAISEEDYLQGLRDAGLIQVEVRERMIYDTTQLEGFVRSEPPVDLRSPCCGAPLPDGLLRQIAGEVTGKVWSAKFYGRKPRG